MSDLILILYFWLTVIVFWYYRKKQSHQKPAILSDSFLATFLKTSSVLWLITTIYYLFVSWVVLVFVAILFYLIKNAKPGFFDENRYGKVELFCLAPISFIYFIRHRTEIKTIENVAKQEEKIRFTDLTLGIFVFLIALSTLEMLLPTDEVARRLQSGQLKPSWALVDFIVLLLSPYKEVLYIATVSVGIMWLFLSIYKQWVKRKK